MDSASGVVPSGTPQNAYVLVVATCAMPWWGNIVVRPSRPAWPELSVTPGLKPTWMAISGGSGNVERSVSPVLPVSIMGSANRS